ncbi:PIG-L family deacetylase [Deinococcus sp. Marseille-Q6407]|uniref:PIG-L family deacetylase n=1 Tax=Deinococcus sp. Marseille-Q6407 TaxID=2969223 RepID=UPI0021BE46F2|nr:PIG-L family deacetylase [Deinococcus sp. Marseille-Q6407]
MPVKATSGNATAPATAGAAHEAPPIPDPKAVKDQDLGITEDRVEAQSIWWWDDVSFYVVAHQDDWQLFMSPEAYADSQQENTKMVMIYLTAGDAGRRSMTPGESYVLAREEGAERSLRFLSDVGTVSHKAATRSQARIGDHLIRRVAYGNTVSYYFRLPDGGFLSQLHDGEIQQLAAVDQSTVYQGWDDLSATLKQVLRKEGSYTAKLHVNLADPDAQINDGDHSDHQETSLLAGGLLTDVPCAEQRLYQTYNTSSLPVNMTPDELLNHAALFGIVESGRADKGFPGAWEPLHKSWLGKHYLRALPASQPVPCF